MLKTRKMAFRSEGGMEEVSRGVGNCGRLWKLFDKNRVVKWRIPRGAECCLIEISRKVTETADGTEGGGRSVPVI